MGDEKRVSQQSGGVNISGGQPQIGDDLVGRDKNVSSQQGGTVSAGVKIVNVYQPPPPASPKLPPSQLPSTRTFRIKQLLLFLSVFTPTAVALVFLLLYYRNVDRPPIPVEVTTDLIADFRGSKGTGALTAFGLPFSMFSDSSQNMASKIWYERIHDETQTGEGFLRLCYQILPLQGREGYVGLYADLTLPPPKPVSLLKYHGIGFRMRISQEIGNYPEVRLVLYSDNIKNMEYAYPIARVRPEKEWHQYNIPFNKLESPPHAFSSVQLDPGRVFRFGFVVVSGSEIHGHIDIGEIRLF